MKTVILFLSLVIAASGAEQIVLQPPLQPAVFEPNDGKPCKLHCRPSRSDNNYCPDWCMKTQEGCVERDTKEPCGAKVTLPGRCFVDSGPCGLGACRDDKTGKWDGLSPGDHEGHCPSANQLCDRCKSNLGRKCDIKDWEVRRACEVLNCDDCADTEDRQSCSECIKWDLSCDRAQSITKYKSKECQAACGFKCFDPTKDCETCLMHTPKADKKNCDLLCEDTADVCRRCLAVVPADDCPDEPKSPKLKPLCEKVELCPKYCATQQDVCDYCVLSDWQYCLDKYEKPGEVATCKKSLVKNHCTEDCIAAYGKDWKVPN